MEEIEDDPVHGWTQTIAEAPDASDHALHQALLVSVGLHRHEGRDGWVSDGADTGQHPGAPHHPRLGTEAVPGEITRVRQSDTIVYIMMKAILFNYLIM